MAIKELTGVSPQDMEGKGNLGRPNPPGVSVEEMQRILDELPREVLVPALNRMAEAQNENNILFNTSLEEFSRELAQKLNKTSALERDNQIPYTPSGDFHPATVLFVREQVEAHAAEDRLHISEEERKLGRLAERIAFSNPAGAFTPAPGVDFALTADSDVTLILNAPAIRGDRFLSMHGFLAIGSEGTADWGSGLMFADGRKPELAAGNCYLLEYFYHPRLPGLPESSGGRWSVRCTCFR